MSLDSVSAPLIWRDIDTNLTPSDKTYTINTTNTNDTTTTITIVNERGAFLDIIDLIISNSKVPFFEEKNIYFQNFKCHYLKMSFCRLMHFLLHEPHICFGEGIIYTMDCNVLIIVLFYIFITHT